MGDVVELAREGEASEAGRLAQESAEAFRAGDLAKTLNRAGDSALAVAYMHLQRIVGVMAVLLPFVLFFGNWALTGDELESSISAYYHTPMGSVFVGVLWALGVFFLSYNYKALPGFNWDNWLSTAASAAAVSVAVFPTTSDVSDPSQSERIIGTVHMVSAGVLFVLLALFALVLFPRSKGDKTPQKRWRNAVYQTCGVIILVSIAMMLVTQKLAPDTYAFLALETVSVEAFGFSWLVKGELVPFLNDPASA